MSTKNRKFVSAILGCALGLWLHCPEGARAYCDPGARHSSSPPLVQAEPPASPLPLKYVPLGEVSGATGPTPKENTLRFSTKYRDGETDLLYYGYRYYSPTSGRWLSRDPIMERGFRVVSPGLPEADPNEGKNLYGFSRQDPVDHQDVLGLFLGIKRCKNPCKWARRHEKTPTTVGVVVCCDGKKYGCLLKSGGSTGATHPIAKRIIDSCGQQHEDYHVSDPMIICEKKCGYDFATYDHLWELMHSECEAWGGEILCLSGLRYQCNGDPSCEAQVDAEMKVAQQAAENYCAPAR